MVSGIILCDFGASVKSGAFLILVMNQPCQQKVSEQCGIAASKGNQILGLIRRNITYMDKN